MIFTSFHLLLLSLLISLCRCVLPRLGEPVCLEAAGTANLAHCNELIRRQMPSPKPDPQGRYSFRHGETRCSGSLPAIIRRQNCLIIVNTLDNRPLATGSWKTLRIEAQKLVDTCVMGSHNGAGGHLRMADGAYLALWGPSSYVAMLRSTGGTVPECLTNVPSNGVDWNAALTEKLRRRNESSETD